MPRRAEYEGKEKEKDRTEDFLHYDMPLLLRSVFLNDALISVDHWSSTWGTHILGHKGRVSENILREEWCILGCYAVWLL
jgi:hypothetical protein